MFGNKRLAKRSIVGTRVSALWPQDGRFYPGIIQAQVSEETVTSGAVYSIRFDDGFTEQIKSRNIVGPGFQPITSATLKRGQKIYLTLNGREVSGLVLRYDRDSDEVLANVRTPTGEDFDCIRRLEDVRLMESRKSARLIDQQDTDYSKLADLQLNEPNRRRTTSHVIDVPTSADKNDSYRRHRPTSDEHAEVDNGGNFDNVEMMDEKIAAMVLTSLSVSPTSPTQLTRHPIPVPLCKEPALSADANCPFPDSHLSSSLASSGFCSGHSERDDSSPPLPPLSESAPANMVFQPPTSGSEDDDSSNGSGQLLICEENASILFECTWRGCKETTTTCDAIERHIRRVHFDRDSDLEMTDNEEEFHYTEVDVTASFINTMTKSFAAMNTSSNEEQKQKHRHRDFSADNSNNSIARKPEGPAAMSRSFGTSGVSDHDYQRKMSKQMLASSVPSTRVPSASGQPASIPISISEGQIKRSLSWQIHSSSPGSMVSPPSRAPKLTPQERLFQHQAQSPKSNIPPSGFKVTQHRRSRSEVRKCRKVYGMEHRDQWCTQCKWKKACTRFVD